MKKRFKFEGLRCANCANKIEDRIKNLEGVLDANVSYFTQSIKLELAEGATLDRIIDESNQIADRIEPGSKIVRK
ncbi:MAG: heavy metal-associated domain-containing protein [Anaerococcus sp.]|nr:heavy-metal-associated domain-containing protein [Anaerococcus sp.]MDD7045443.1 heavy metal-associated domain-containing protein [Peptoniphilaceae bacterium]MDY2919245.1 heavy metal-associated domain-containing protein [Anaerococcus sp.]